jgi:hypothetical protein
MTKDMGSARRRERVALAILGIGLLVGSAGQAWAYGPGSTFETARGPGFITGNVGSMETTTIPGSPGQGLLMDNGNGTSTLLVPGGLPQVVGTPR